MGLQSMCVGTSESKRPLYRYGMLVAILGLLVGHVHWHITLPPTYDGDPYDSYVFILFLLLYHLAFAFKWSRLISIVLSILVWSWFAFTVFYCCYWTHVRYP